MGKEEEKGISKKRFLALALFCLIMVSGGAVLLDGLQLQASEKKETGAPPSMPAMPVETAEVRVADSDRLIAAIGNLQAEESVVIAAEIPGRVQQIGFVEGGLIVQGERLIRLDSSVLQAELDRAIASRDLSRANYQRAEALLTDRAVSAQERDEAFARWQLDEAGVRLANAQLEKATIRAPFSGTLGLRQVSQGDYIQPGQPLVNLEAISRLKVEFRVPEKYLAEVKVGQLFELQSEAYPGRIFAGEVYAVDPLVEEQSRSLVARGLIDNRGGELLPGQFVRVQLSIATRSGALFIPEQALIPQPKTPLVFKVVADKAQMVPVEIGARQKGWVEIVSGLAAGDVVITGGHQKIGPGSQVLAVPADPSLFARLN
ncbi:MAG: efflux RND transporter periplasmic adaptor subunit [Desulfuromonadales bacterium]|nr:efflux RND transporter periplasmic adaptor subunit [Desulfuromonadales bacterium]